MLKLNINRENQNCSSTARLVFHNVEQYTNLMLDQFAPMHYWDETHLNVWFTKQVSIILSQSKHAA